MRMIDRLLVWAPWVAVVICAVMAIPEWIAPQIVIEWETASELDILGFHIYRVGSDGQEDRVTEQIIPASPDPLIGGSYQFIDNQVQIFQEYAYELEDIGASGAGSRYGPISARALPGTWSWLALIFLIGAILGQVLVFRKRSTKSTVSMEESEIRFAPDVEK